MQRNNKQRMQAPGPIKKPEPPPHPAAPFALFGILGIGIIFIAMIIALSNQNNGYTSYDIDNYISQAQTAMGCMMVGLIFVIGSFFVVAATQRQPRKLLEDAEQEQERERKKRTSSASALIQRTPDSTEGLAILGAAIYGTLQWCNGPWLTLPEPELAKHGVIIGGSGSGKTESLLRLACIAATVYGYRVFFLDAKGDRTTAAQFLAMMHYTGQDAHMFPREALSGWRGDGNAIMNRLMSVELFSEAYYKAVAKRVLTLICNDPAGPPRTSAEFFNRFTDDLRDRAKLTPRDLAGVELRYRAFFDALNGRLDAGWSWEDTSAAYILLDGLSLKEEAASLGRFLIEDFSHYATTRKRPGRDLLIIDEYSALAQSGTDAANLVERLRSYGCAVVLSSQSYAGLGEPQDAERILDAANWLLLHRSAAPEQLVTRAGTKQEIKKTYQFGGNPQKGIEPGNIQMEELPAIHPDEVKRLETGQAVMIAHGHYLKVKIAQAQQPSAANIQAARQWIDSPAPAIQAQTMTTRPTPTPASAPAPNQRQAQAPTGQPSQPLVRLMKPTTSPHQAQQPSAPMIRLPQRPTNTGQQPAARPGPAPQRQQPPQQDGPELL
jgi:hypothetical protein